MLFDRRPAPPLPSPTRPRSAPSASLARFRRGVRPPRGRTWSDTIGPVAMEPTYSSSQPGRAGCTHCGRRWQKRGPASRSGADDHVVSPGHPHRPSAIGARPQRCSPGLGAPVVPTALKGTPHAGATGGLHRRWRRWGDVQGNHPPRTPITLRPGRARRFTGDRQSWTSPPPSPSTGPLPFDRAPLRQLVGSSWRGWHHMTQRCSGSASWPAPQQRCRRLWAPNT